MLEQTFHTPLPLTLEVSIPAGEIAVETVEGDQSTVEVTGDERLLEEVEIRQDGDRLVVALRGKSKFGFVVAFGSQVFGNAGLRVQAQIPHGCDPLPMLDDLDAPLLAFRIDVMEDEHR